MVYMRIEGILILGRVIEIVDQIVSFYIISDLYKL